MGKTTFAGLASNIMTYKHLCRRYTMYAHNLYIFTKENHKHEYNVLNESPFYYILRRIMSAIRLKLTSSNYKHCQHYIQLRYN